MPKYAKAMSLKSTSKNSLKWVKYPIKKPSEKHFLELLTSFCIVVTMAKQ